MFSLKMHEGFLKPTAAQKQQRDVLIKNARGVSEFGVT
jgi:hypothetical protein